MYTRTQARYCGHCTSVEPYPSTSKQGCSPRGVLGFLDPSPVSPRPPRRSRGASAWTGDRLARLVPALGAWARPLAPRFAPVLHQILPRQASAKITITGAILPEFCTDSSQILKISHCKGAGPLDPRDIMPLLLLRALQGAAKGVAGLDLGLRDPPRRAGETASVVEPRYRSCDCFLERPRLRRRFLAAWPRFTSVFVDAHSARYRGLPRAWLGLIWAFVTHLEGPARQLV
jgi:hypothetical protein